MCSCCLLPRQAAGAVVVASGGKRERCRPGCGQCSRRLHCHSSPSPSSSCCRCCASRWRPMEGLRRPRRLARFSRSSLQPPLPSASTPSPRTAAPPPPPRLLLRGRLLPLVGLQLAVRLDRSFGSLCFFLNVFLRCCSGVLDSGPVPPHLLDFVFWLAKFRIWRGNFLLLVSSSFQKCWSGNMVVYWEWWGERCLLGSFIFQG